MLRSNEYHTRPDRHAMRKMPFSNPGDYRVHSEVLLKEIDVNLFCLVLKLNVSINVRFFDLSNERYYFGPYCKIWRK